MQKRKLAIILAAAALGIAGVAVAILLATGIDLVALVTARQAEVLPQEEPPAAAPEATPEPGGSAPRALDVTPVKRPATWAVAIDRPGLPNFYKVSDNLYRGAQPAPEGFQELAKLGIKTVLNLRSMHTDGDAPAAAGLAYEAIPMDAWGIKSEHAVRFLQIVTDKSRTPVFVHCQFGADRTGTLCAVYRVAVQGWSKDEAVREMTTGGFGYHPGWGNLVRFIGDLDVEAIRAKAGLPNLTL